MPFEGFTPTRPYRGPEDQGFSNKKTLTKELEQEGHEVRRISFATNSS
jgi:hypothetical protein